MTSVRVSDKGQVTLPAKSRRRYSVKPRSRMEVIETDEGILLKPEPSIMDACGALSEYARGDAEDWERVRTEMEKAVAEEVDNAWRRGR